MSDGEAGRGGCGGIRGRERLWGRGAPPVPAGAAYRALRTPPARLVPSAVNKARCATAAVPLPPAPDRGCVCLCACFKREFLRWDSIFPFFDLGMKLISLLGLLLEEANRSYRSGMKYNLEKHFIFLLLKVTTLGFRAIGWPRFSHPLQHKLFNSQLQTLREHRVIADMGRGKKESRNQSKRKAPTT